LGDVLNRFFVQTKQRETVLLLQIIVEKDIGYYSRGCLAFVEVPKSWRLEKRLTGKLRDCLVITFLEPARVGNFLHLIHVI